MPLPPRIQQTYTRVRRAEAAWRADIESGQPYDSKRRNRLRDEYNEAEATLHEQLAQLAKSMARKK